MKEEEIITFLEQRIKSCHKDLLFAKSQKGYRKDWIEGFRCRLDELILLYHEILDMNFYEACEELGIKREDVEVPNSDEVRT